MDVLRNGSLWKLAALGFCVAQELKTPFPVSFKRLEKAWAELTR